MSRAARRVFDGDRLRATLFNPGGTRLLVTFRQRVSDAGRFSDPAPVQGFVNRGYAHLHLQSRWNDWFINAETPALEQALSRLADRHEVVQAMGFSMGAYAALRFARNLNLRDVVLVSPQVSIHPDVVPWDGRYAACAAGFDRQMGDLGCRAVPGLRGILAYDPFRAPDRRNARAIGRLFPGLQLCALSGGGHPATQVLRLGGAFGKLQLRLREDRLERRWVVQEHRRLRSESAVYWARLAKFAGGRGREALAETAARIALVLRAADAE
ncbi:alpha/beta hydrolase [Sedimentitalea sp. HM32M-2]|uniref:alpha/beta hydrolase n=1 Tax=Sedimentitalea sp. HM32M-2 TaxID=3351566 RepID=UPI00362B26BB